VNSTRAFPTPSIIQINGEIRLGSGLFKGTYGALGSSLLVLGLLWTFCWWLWKRKIFIKI
jgi:ABC-type uncharacterized transport system permease subunit